MNPASKPSIRTAATGTSTPPLLIGYILVLLTGILASGPILLSDYVIWDSWWTNHFLYAEGQLPHLKQIIGDIGRPLDFYFIYLSKLMGAPGFGSKLSAVLFWISTPIVLAAFLRRARFMSRSESLLVGALGVALPFFDLLGESCVLMNTISPFLFWSAWLILISLRKLPASLYIIGRCLTLLLFALSFNLNSTLVLFYGVACALAVSHYKKSDGAESIKTLFRRAIAHLDFLILPILFWVWKGIYCSPRGFYALENYNKIYFDFKTIRIGIILHARMFADEVFDAASSVPRVMITAGVFSACALWVSKDRDFLRKITFSPSNRTWRLLLTGTILLGSAIAPYILAKKSAGAFGWDSRNAVLLNYPTAIIIVAALRLAQLLLLPQRPRILPTLLIAVICTGIVSSNCSMLRLQGLGAKQECIRRKLAPFASRDDVRVISLRDYYLIPQTIPFYPHVVWTYLVASGLPSPKVMVIDTRNMAPDQIKEGAKGTQEIGVPLVTFSDTAFETSLDNTSIRYALGSINRKGLTINAIVTRGSQGDNGTNIGLKYLYYKFFATKSLGGFLDSLANVQIAENK